MFEKIGQLVNVYGLRKQGRRGYSITVPAKFIREMDMEEKGGFEVWRVGNLLVLRPVKDFEKSREEIKTRYSE